MAVLSGPGPSGTSSFQSNPAGAPFGSVGNASGSGFSGGIGANGGMRSPSYGPLQGGGHLGFDLGNAGVGAGGAFGNGTMAGGGKSGGLPRSQSHSATTMPLLQPPTRDTPPFRSSHLNGSRGSHANGQNHAAQQQPAGSAPGAMVVYGAGGGTQQGMMSPQQQPQQPGPGAMVLHGGSQAGGAGMRGNVDRGFDQVGDARGILFSTAAYGLAIAFVQAGGAGVPPIDGRRSSSDAVCPPGSMGLPWLCWDRYDWNFFLKAMEASEAPGDVLVPLCLQGLPCGGFVPYAVTLSSCCPSHLALPELLVDALRYKP